MSQEKVDKRKYEKLHRKEIEKKRKLKFAAKCIVVALIIGAAIGIPVGQSIYKSIPKYVGDSSLEAFVGNYMDDNYSSEMSVLSQEDEATTESTEAENEVEEAVKEATGTELESVDVEDTTQE